MAKRQIIWSHRANLKLFELLEFYNERNKSKEYAKKLYKKLVNESNLLAKLPEIGIRTEIDSVRGLIVDGFILFYEITSDKIVIHTIWDCKQNPADLKIR